MYTSHPTAALAVLTVVAGTLTDMLRHRIPNTITVTAAVLGLALRAWTGGLDAFTDGLAGLAAMFVLMIPFYALRWMGAGDVKMMMAVGALLGLPVSLWAYAATIGCGSLLAFTLIALRGGLLTYLRRYGSMLKCLLLTGRCAYVPPGTEESAATQRFPYACAITIGTLAAMYGAGQLQALAETINRVVGTD